LEQQKSYLVPNTINMNSIIFMPESKLLYRSADGSDEQVEVDVDLWEDSSYWTLTAPKVISKYSWVS
jgi:hypothetical protein